MDYCSACRRKLNGALVCSGCGAYAPDIDPWLAAARRAAGAQESRGEGRTAATGRAVAVEEGVRPPQGPVEDLRPRVRDEPAPARAKLPLPPRAAAAEPLPAAEPAPVADAEPQFADAAPERSRPAAPVGWLKGRRTAAAATALAFIGGGLTLAAMSSDAQDPGDHKDTASSSTPDAAGALPRATSAPAVPTTARPSATHRAPARHTPSSHVPGLGHQGLPGGQVMPPASTTSSSASQTGVPYSSPSNRPGTHKPPTSSSSAPSASPTSTPRHRVCILSLCFD